MSDSDKDYNSLKEQKDPIIMYLVVHEIGMSTGKISAQVGHAVGKLYLQYFKYFQNKNDSLLAGEKVKEWNDWQSEFAFRKVTLTANDSKWKKLKAQLADSGLEYCLIVDAGLTEIPSGSETVIGIWPMHKSKSPPALRKLQPL